MTTMDIGKEVAALCKQGKNQEAIDRFYSLSSNSKCNTTSPAGLRCCHVNKILSTHDCRRT